MTSMDEREMAARDMDEQDRELSGEQPPDGPTSSTAAAREEAAPLSESRRKHDEAGHEPRGFAGMDESKQRQIASRGGKAAHEKGTAHEFTPDEARKAGRKGGESVSQNRQHMAAIGRKGGERVSQDREHMAQIGRKGGEVVSGDRDHMAQIGRKGGEARGGEHH
jgi:uncharacterized protein